MKHLTGPEFLPSRNVSSAVIFLHGLGSNGNDLLSLSPWMSRDLPNTAFFAPNAPLPVPFTLNGYQWFEYWDRTPAQIEDGVRDATPSLVDFVENVTLKLKIPVSKIALVGFSQGTMMSLHAGLREIQGLGGIVGFSGALMAPESFGQEKLKKLPPVLLVHGVQDPVVPIIASRYAETAIQKFGGDVRLVERPYLPHSIDDVGISESVKFLQRIFGEKK